MTLFGSLFKFDGEGTKILENIFQNFFKQPKWLLITLLIVIIGGGGYYIHSYNLRKEIVDLSIQVEQLNELANQNLSVKDYKNDLRHIIAESQIIDYYFEQIYAERTYEIDCLIDFFARQHNDESICIELEALKSRIEMNREMYEQYHNHIMRELKSIINDSTSVSINK